MYYIGHHSKATDTPQSKKRDVFLSWNDIAAISSITIKKFNPNRRQVNISETIFVDNMGKFTSNRLEFSTISVCVRVSVHQTPHRHFFGAEPGSKQNISKSFFLRNFRRA